MFGSLDLLRSRPLSHVWINPNVEIHERDGLRVAMVRGEPVGVWAAEDKVAEELFVIHAHEAGLCTIEEAGPALGLGVRTLYRSSARVRAQGASAILHRPSGGQPAEH